MVRPRETYTFNRVMVDFDGVLHRYSRGWQDGNIYDAPIPGAQQFMHELAGEAREVVILTARDEQYWPAMREWMDKHGFIRVRITNIKEPADAYVDDLAVSFRGMWGETWDQLNSLWEAKRHGSTNT